MKKLFFSGFLFFIILSFSVYADVSVIAASGHWSDIQAAVDQVAAAGGGRLHIPAGDWNVVNVGETWTGFLINVPTNISVFGAPTQRDADGMVVNYETRLIIPWAASPEHGSHGPIIFGFHGNEFGNDFTRISEIEFIGYNNPAHDWQTRRTYMIAAIGLDYVNEYRVDHIRTENMRGGGVKVWGREARGVIDHSSFENPVWYSEGAAMSDMDIGYGIAPSRIGFNFQTAREKLLGYWNMDDRDVLGKYTRYSHYIEDCYFTTWRHAIASNWGAHYVVRHSTFEDEYVFGTVDAHGWGFYGCYAPDGYWCYNSGPYDTYMAENYPDWTEQEKDDYWEVNKVVGWLGTRAFEVYNNTFEGPDPDRSHGSVIFARGGASVHFNNDIGLNSDGIRRYFEAGNEGTWEESWNRIWIWDNNLGPTVSLNAPTSDPDIPVVESKPDWYTPYTYPHPLTIDSENSVDINGEFSESIESKVTAYHENTNIVANSVELDNEGRYNLKLFPGIYDIQYNVLKSGFFIPNFFLKFLSINVTSHITNLVKRIREYPEEKKLMFEINITKPTIIQTYSPEKPKEILLNRTSLVEVASLSDLKNDAWFYDSVEKKLHMSVTPVPVVTAASGSAIDIQAAVDLVAAAGGGNVHIPAGTFNFVEPGQLLSDYTVNVPAGVNIFGAPTQKTIGLTVPEYGRNPNDQVVAWETILVIPADSCAPSGPTDTPGPTWFSFSGSGNPNESSRISDIKMVGYRSFDASSTQMSEGIRMVSVADFRVDHCHLENLAGMGVRVGAGTLGHIGFGLIDHNRIENPAGGIPEPWGDTTIIYGISLSRGINEVDWNPDITAYMGQYTDHSTFIEDNYFSKWRHSIVGNMGVHYVNRYNTFDADYGYGTVDGHGGNVGTLGTRAMEHYNNEFINLTPSGRLTGVMFWRGGGGVFWNNYEDGSYETGSPFGGSRLVFLTVDNGLPISRIKDLYIWDNTHGCYYTDRVEASAVPHVRLDQEYFLRAPNLVDDGWEYTPYQYPHPLTIE